MIWDLGLLGLFVILISLFLYRNKKSLKKEGLLWLYHTSWGIKIIERTGKKWRKFLKVSSYVAVWLGYALMGIMVYLFGRLVWIYAFHSEFIKASLHGLPPVMPLVPYLPQMFKLSFLPPFYFSYWIIILAVIAITHEFFHGIYAALAGVKTKTTGFGFFPFFFPVFLAAFVNLDEKAMEKKKNFEQRAVLAAGTFANTLTAILGVILMFIFFTLTYSPSGIVFDDYAYNVVNVTNISSINGVPINWNENQINELQNISEYKNIEANGINYYGIKGVDSSSGLVGLYYDAPGINSNLTGVIQEINGEKITSLDKLSEELMLYSPGEKINVSTYDGTVKNTIEVTLEENPFSEGKSWLGVSFLDNKPNGVFSTISYYTTAYKKTNVYYEPDFLLAKFIYDLLWWLVLISFSVALVNMLPMGIFDGGRFFYLTILKLTKSQKAAEKSFKRITQFFLFLLFVIMFFWAKSFF
ncbi:hypothetical protein GW932_04770 [archaeon]|nr:hypothetical protein [archaeon]